MLIVMKTKLVEVHSVSRPAITVSPGRSFGHIVRSADKC